MLSTALFLLSCAPAKRTVQADSREATESRLATTTATHITTQGVTTAASDVARREIVETITTEYDTAKPADPATGLPPVLRTCKQVRRQDTDVQTTSTQTSQGEAKADTREQRHARSDITSAVSSEQRRGLTWWQKTLCYTAAAALLMLLARRFFRLLKTN